MERCWSLLILAYEAGPIMSLINLEPVVESSFKFRALHLKLISFHLQLLEISQEYCHYRVNHGGFCELVARSPGSRHDPSQ